MSSDRRVFLKSVATAAAPVFSARKLSANDKPTYGVIGTGGRGRYLNRYFQKTQAQCVALCDVYDLNLEQAAKESPAGVKKYVDYTDLLAQPGIDFIVVGSPDHQHWPHLKASLAAGKDVYLEKPLSHSLAQSQLMVDAVKKSGKVVQVGMQRRSAPALFQAKRIVDDGRLGRISAVRAQWNWNVSKPLNNSPLPGKLDWARFLGPAPMRELEPMRFRNWRVFWDYSGGNMTDQGTHLMDVVQWFTGARPPLTSVTQGYVAKMVGAEAPDVFSTVFDSGEFMTTWTLDYCNAYENGWQILFQGDKGTLKLDDAGFSFWEEPWKKDAPPTVAEVAPVPIETHIANFLECLQTRKEPNSTVALAQRAVAGPHLANMAFKQKRQVSLASDLVTVS